MSSAILLDKKSRHLATPCTFIVKIMHTDRNTIQGYVQWIEKEKTVAFRSYMELMHLTQEALRNNNKRSINFRSWKN